MTEASAVRVWLIPHWHSCLWGDAVVPVTAAVIAALVCASCWDARECAISLASLFPRTSPCGVLKGHGVIFSDEAVDVYAWFQHLLCVLENPCMCDVCVWLSTQTGGDHGKGLHCASVYLCVLALIKLPWRASMRETNDASFYPDSDKRQGERFKDSLLIKSTGCSNVGSARVEKNKMRVL